MKFIYQFFLIFLITVVAFYDSLASYPPFVKFKQDKWVADQLDKLSLEEKIAQLMMITVYPDQGEISKNKIIKLIEQFKPGGILIMKGTPVETVKWINDFQKNSATPLLVAVDGEWGPAMRTDSIVEFPYAQALGAVQDSVYIEQMGKDIGNQLKTMGIHMNFAPVADINTNPSNPVINFRSFGENKVVVAKRAWWLASGMQQEGIIAVAKHFPGHGDTSTDSHNVLPFLGHSKSRLDTLESYPFRYLSEKGICGIMSAHLNVPALDETGIPSTLSSKTISGYLKTEIGFNGFVVTDAINMKGVRTKEGNTELRALMAGNDLVEFVPDLNAAILSVKKGVETGKISEAEINEKCRTILSLKRWCGLNNYQPADLENIVERLNSPNYEVTLRKLIKGSLTVLKNKQTLPVQGLDTLKIATINFGESAISGFQQMIDKYTVADHFSLSKNADVKQWQSLRSKLKNYNLIIAGIQGINIYPANKYGTTEIQRKAVAELTAQNRSIVVLFGNAYALKHFENTQNADGLIVAYQNNNYTQELAAQLIFGAFDADGKLPVSADQRFYAGDGLVIKKNSSFSFTIPEEVGISQKQLELKIDSIARLGIEQKAFPGCQVLIAKNGSVIFHKCYGFHTYEKKNPVKTTDLYDWASVTKVTGPLPVLMKLVDEKKIDLNAPFSKYWPDFKNTDKGKFTLRDALAHQAGLAAWLPFWMMASDREGKINPEIFKDRPTDVYSIRVSEKLYMNKNYKKTMYDTIRNSKLKPPKKYLYSDLSFLLYPEIIETLTGENYENYLKKNFYHPLGARTITYNPHKYFPLNLIIPTETDDFFRHESLRGFVHDEGAAMLGGISGNAGLFGTANDLAKVFQMYLQKGFFGGKRYISEKTVNEFTRVQFPENNNRRALGFDKPLLNNSRNTNGNGYPASDANPLSFGHSGYTGTFVWADPANGMLYLFLSNRVHPTRENDKISNLNIRTAMYQEIYDCIKAGLE